MRSVNTVVIPEYSEELIFNSIRDAHEDFLEKETAEKNTALDFYYNRNMDSHIEKWFNKKTLDQIPPYQVRIVPRFARARMMLYKKAPLRMINGEESEDYKDIAHKLNSKTREFAELTWLVKDMGFRTKFNPKKERLEYDLIPFYRKYYLEGEGEHFAVSYEVGKDKNGNRVFVFFSEPRDGQPGLHFKFTQGGSLIPVNEDNLNPYGLIPVSFASYNQNAYDVVRMAIHLGMAYTEIALALKFAFGQPVATGLDDSQNKIELGIDKVMLLPDGSDFNFKSSATNLIQSIDAAKAFGNQTALNHHLRIKWDEKGQALSGEAIRLLEIENLESRISDIPLWREWENERYEIDREVYNVHTGKDLGEGYAVDFAEVEFPQSPQEVRAELDWKLEKGLISREDLFRHFNPDISNEDLQKKLSEVDESKKVEAEAVKPTSPIERLLNA